MLRKQFAAQMTIRFRALKGDINTSIITNDGFGLKPSPFGRRLRILAAAPYRAFDFPTSAGKVDAFMQWLREQEDEGILELIYGEGREIVGSSEWMNTYIDTAYKKGLRRGNSELVKAGLPSALPGLPAFSVTAAFNRPIHADRVGLLYTRAFNELEGITDAMDQQISRILAQGMIEGQGPAQLARTINDRVDKIGLTRARVLARTETIRAHHVAMINTYREAGILGVTVKAEWATAGSNVCPDCAGMQGRVFKLDEIEGLIPLHPNCRCVAIPAMVGERPGERGVFDESTIGAQYKDKEGDWKERGFFEEKTDKPKPSRVR